MSGSEVKLKSHDNHTTHENDSNEPFSKVWLKTVKWE